MIKMKDLIWKHKPSSKFQKCLKLEAKQILDLRLENLLISISWSLISKPISFQYNHVGCQVDG